MLFSLACCTTPRRLMMAGGAKSCMGLSLSLAIVLCVASSCLYLRHYVFGGYVTLPPNVIMSREKRLSPEITLPGLDESRLADDVMAKCSVKVTYPEKLTLKEKRVLFRNMMYDDKYRVVFCYLSKVGCSNWKRVFAVMKSHNTSLFKLQHHDLHNRSAHHYNVLADLNGPEALRRLQTYRKVMFVRNPVTRLLAVYRDLVATRSKSTTSAVSKFMHEYFFSTRLVSLIGHKLKPSDVNITLTSFVKLVLEEEDPSDMDEHWRPYITSCLPCTVNYTYIGRHEQLPTSANDILQALGVTDVQFPNSEPDYKDEPVRIQSSAEQYKKVSQTLVKKLWRRYSDDMKLFGYSEPVSLGSEDGSPVIEPDTLEEYLRG
ncbi:carbohydrate sulfotransferase 14-like [Sycon ciliatum]|uniref:carbohydrate sulfotransferase 14-like n=1 Tax=Sycon ciliatum TaxID=27933 RepID=UPI0031F61D03